MYSSPPVWTPWNTCIPHVLLCSMFDGIRIIILYSSTLQRIQPRPHTIQTKPTKYAENTTRLPYSHTSKGSKVSIYVHEKLLLAKGRSKHPRCVMGRSERKEGEGPCMLHQRPSLPSRRTWSSSSSSEESVVRGRTCVHGWFHVGIRLYYVVFHCVRIRLEYSK